MFTALAIIFPQQQPPSRIENSSGSPRWFWLTGKAPLHSSIILKLSLITDSEIRLPELKSQLHYLTAA